MTNTRLHCIPKKHKKKLYALHAARGILEQIPTARQTTILIANSGKINFDLIQDNVHLN